MFIRIFPPLIIMDVVYPDTGCIMDNISFSGYSVYLIAGVLFTGTGYSFVYAWSLCNLLVISSLWYLCNRDESGLKTHWPSRGFGRRSLSEIC